MFVSDLITSSLRLLGVVASGDLIPTVQITDGLSSLNAMLDSWATQRLLIPSLGRFVFTLIPGKGTYTIGPVQEGTADIQTTRPLSIRRAGLIISQPDPTQAIEQPLDVLTEGEWALVKLKGLNSTFPQALYYETDYPFGQIALYPVPSQVNQVALYVAQPLAQFTTTGVIVDLPPGYLKAMRYCLAVELAPEYGIEPSPLIVQQALLSLQYLKAQNAMMRRGKLRVDPALRSTRGLFDWMTGESK